MKIFEFNNLSKIITIIISFTLIVFLYLRIDLAQFLNILENCNYKILIAAFFLNIGLGLIGGIRFSFYSKYLGKIRPPDFSTSTKSFFLASLINIFLPSKIGDLSKGFICGIIDNKKYPIQLHIYTLYEKISDLFAVLIIGIVSYLFFILNLNINNEITNNLNQIVIQNKYIILIYFLFATILICFLFPFKSHDFIRKYKVYLPKKIISLVEFNLNISYKKFFFYQLTTLSIWFIQILQVCILAKSINLDLFSLTGFFIIIFTILFGLLPISLAGIGTRESLLVFLLSPYFGETYPILLGALMTTRYIIPATIGLLYINNFLKKTKNLNLIK